METRIGSCFLGRTLELSNGKIVVGVTLDVGPRIIKLQKPGGENLMFEDVADNVNKDVSAVYGEGKKWHIYGGHRIWLSPESLETYYPDNAPVVSELKPNGAIFTPPAWTERGVQPVLDLEFTPDGALEVRMRVKNISDVKQKLCVWGLTVMKCGGTLTLPLSTEDTGFLANRNLVLCIAAEDWDANLRRLSLVLSDLARRGELKTAREVWAADGNVWVVEPENV